MKLLPYDDDVPHGETNKGKYWGHEGMYNSTSARSDLILRHLEQ